MTYPSRNYNGLRSCLDPGAYPALALALCSRSDYPEAPLFRAEGLSEEQQPETEEAAV